MPVEERQFPCSPPQWCHARIVARAATMLPLKQFKRLDVRPILARGEDPLSAIRAKISALKSDQGLIVIAPFLPSPLIMLLGGEGFKSKVERGGAGEWIVYFW